MPDLEPIPEGMMRVWDADQKKVILVPAPPSGPDILTLTVRLHDPKEKQDRAKAAVWHIVKIPRAALSLAEADFAANHLTPAAAVILAPHKTTQMAPSPASLAPASSASLPVDQEAVDATAPSKPSPSPVVSVDSPAPPETPQPSSSSETDATEAVPQKSSASATPE